jgi:hypothetical protein
MNFQIIDENNIVTIQKYRYESFEQFAKRTEFYLKAKKAKIEEDRAVTLSVAYINKLKFNVIYNSKLESELSLFID